MARNIQLDRRLNVGEAYNKGFDLFGKQAGPLIGASAIGVAIEMVVYGILAAIQFALQMAMLRMGPMLILVLLVYQWLVEGPLNWFALGACLMPVDRLILGAMAGKPVKAGDMLQKPGTHFRYGFSTLLLMAAVIFPMMLVFGVGLGLALATGFLANSSMGLVAFMLVAGVLGLVVGLAILPFMVLLPYLVIDNPDLGIFQCMGLNIRMSMKNFFPLMGVSIGSWFIGSAGVILCFIGLCLTYPIGSAIRAAAYRQLVPLQTLTPEEVKQARIKAMEVAQDGYIETDGGWDQSPKKD